MSGHTAGTCTTDRLHNTINAILVIHFKERMFCQNEKLLENDFLHLFFFVLFILNVNLNVTWKIYLARKSN